MKETHTRLYLGSQMVMQTNMFRLIKEILLSNRALGLILIWPKQLQIEILLTKR